MQTLDNTFTGVADWETNISGNYLAILSSTNNVNIKLFKAGRKLDLGDVRNVGAGLEIGPLKSQDGGYAFDRVIITSTGADTVQIGVGNGDARYSPRKTTAAVPVSGAYTQTQKTVTNASATLVAANSSRQALEIYNKDLSGTVYIVFGASATVALGIAIPPGQSYYPAGAMPTGVISAIGDIASNANIIVVEG